MVAKNKQQSPRDISEPPRYKVNLPLVVGTLLAMSLLAVAAHFWHSRQLRSLATSLLDRASNLEEKEEYRKASDYIFRYLRVRPSDAPARVRLARTYDKSIASGGSVNRAVNLYYRAIGVADATENAELRHRLTELLLQSGRFLEAESEALELLALDSADPFGQRAFALALFGRYQTGQLKVSSSSRASDSEDSSSAASAGNPAGQDGSTGGESGETRIERSRNLGEALETAIAANPDQVDLAVKFAVVLRDAPQYLGEEQRRDRFTSVIDRQEAADRAVDQAVAAADTAEAFLTRFLYREQYKLPGGEQDLADAMKREPDNVRVLLVAASHAHTKAELSRPPNASQDELGQIYRDAEAKYRRVIELDPANVDALLGLSELLRVQGDLAGGLQVLKSGLAELDRVDQRLALQASELMIFDDQLTSARDLLTKFDKDFTLIGPQLPPAVRRSRELQRHWLEANLLLRSGQAIQAIDRVRLTTSSESSQVQFRGWYTLGQCCAAVGQRERAAEAFAQAAGLKPESLETRLAAANAWIQCGQPGQAIPHLLHALSIANAPDIRATLASTYLELQKYRRPDQRDWLAFEEQMSTLEGSQVQEAMERPWVVTLLRVRRSLMDAGEEPEDQAAAIALLKALETKYPNDPDLFERLVVRYESLNAPKDAERALKLFQESSDEPAAPPFLEASLLARRRRYDEAIAVLQQANVDDSESARALIERGLVETYRSAGRWQDARKPLMQQLKRQPNDPQVMLQLGELALRTDDYAAVASWEDRLRDKSCEGEKGTYWRYLKAMRLLQESNANPDESNLLDESHRLQRELRRLRQLGPGRMCLRG